MTLIKHRGRVVDTDTGQVYGREIATHVDSSGYRQVYLEQGVTQQAHRFIWEAAHGPIPDGLQINHLNGDKADNRLENLELCTHVENLRHAYRTGLASNAGIRHPGAKLTEEQVYAFRVLFDSGLSATQIHHLHPYISRRQIALIEARKAWAHLPEQAA